MNKEGSRPDSDSVVQGNERGVAAAAPRRGRLGLTAALGASLVLFLSEIQHAQQRYKEPAVKVTGVATAGNVVSISADGSLNRAQTWQDPDGRFHVVLPNGQAELSGPAQGVKVQHVGNSLELVIPVKRGASVTVEPHGDRLDLVVSGGAGGALNVENFPTETTVERAPAPKSRAPRGKTQQREQAAQEDARAARREAAASKRRGPAEPTSAPPSSSRQQPSQQSPQQPSQPSPQ